jgi:hypothetical protein
MRLDGADFFKCKYFNATLLKIRCVERQRLFGMGATLSYLYCRTCDQGKNIKEELLSEKLRPKRGEGDREIDCVFYDNCLDYAAKKDWKSFKCEDCTIFKPGAIRVMESKDKPKNTRICETEDCGRITLSPGSPFCGVCMAKKSHEARAANNKGCDATENTTSTKAIESAGVDKLVPDIVDPGGDMKIVVSFKDYESILIEIKKLARDQCRSLELQIIYMIKTQLIG